jgi:hypothetical protein
VLVPIDPVEPRIVSCFATLDLAVCGACACHR